MRHPTSATATPHWLNTALAQQQTGPTPNGDLVWFTIRVVAIELCVESIGAFVHAAESVLFTNLGDQRRRLRKSSSTGHQVDVHQVRAATSELPYPEARSLWLVDVCGYSYDQTAEATHASRSVVADRITRARQTIRAAIQ